MKILDKFMYILYTASGKMSIYKSEAMHEYYARSSFCFLLATLGAILLTTVIFNITMYRHWVNSVMSPVMASLFGMVHLLSILFIIFYYLKEIYTNERIKQVAASYNGMLSPTWSVIIYIIFFIINFLLSFYLLISLIALFMDKKISIGI